MYKTMGNYGLLKPVGADPGDGDHRITVLIWV
jgi:hypothetical protein